jgi:hypothetical protein
MKIVWSLLPPAPVSNSNRKRPCAVSRTGKDKRAKTNGQRQTGKDKRAKTSSAPTEDSTRAFPCVRTGKDKLCPYGRQRNGVPMRPYGQRQAMPVRKTAQWRSHASFLPVIHPSVGAELVSAPTEGWMTGCPFLGSWTCYKLPLAKWAHPRYA